MSAEPSIEIREKSGGEDVPNRETYIGKDSKARNSLMHTSKSEVGGGC